MTGTLLTGMLAALRRHPGALAIRADDRTATWAELFELASRYATGYRRHGIQPGDRVAVLLEPGIDAVAAAVAAFRVRAAFVPMDPAQPRARLATLLTAARPRIVVSAADATDEHPAPGGASISDTAARPARDAASDLAARPAADLPAGGAARLTPACARSLDPTPAADLADPGEESDVAYVVHTSGSTGLPKAVQVEHRNVVNLIEDLDEQAPVPARPIGTWWTRPSFDVAIWECFAPLRRGGSVHVVPAGARHDGAALAAFLDRGGAQTCYVPPAYLPDLLALLRADPGSLAGLRRLLVGVEPIARELLQAIARSRPGLVVVNGYGPAETTICCTRYVVPRDGGAVGERTPIGTPVRGNVLHLRQSDGSYRSSGTGELVVVGANVARGYLSPVDGKAGFLIDPVDGTDARAYRTGDLVRTLPDGNLLFLGRADRQLKIRGFRIEPGEIETVLRQVPGVRDVVVSARHLDGLGRVVVAFVVATPGVDLDDRRIRDHAADRLPAHAVPGAVVFLPRLPLTAHGKYDHDALASMPLPPVARPPAPRDISGGPSAPSAGDAVERVLAAWRRVLPVSEVRPEDGFGQLSGTSIGAAWVAAELRERTGAPVTTADVLCAPSAADLGALLNRREPAAEPATATATADQVHPGARCAPLSPDQLGLWLDDELRPEAGLYVEPVCFATEQPVDRPRLVDAVGRAVRAHPAFGAGLDLTDDLPTLVLGRHEPITPELLRLPAAAGAGDSSPAGGAGDSADGDGDGSPAGGDGDRGADAAAPEDAVLERALRPFDTATEPLLRCAVVERGDRTLLLFVWHHLVVDAWSLGLFLGDLGRCYDDPDWTPTPVSTTVCDLASRRLAWVDGPAGRAATQATVDRIRAVPVPDLPARDSTRRLVVSRGLQVRADTLSKAAHAEGGTLTEAVGAAYARALAETFDLDDLVIGCAASTRSAADEFEVAGYAVNTLLLHCRDVRRADRSTGLARFSRELRRASAEQTSFFEVARQVLRGTGRPPGSFPMFYLDSVDEPDLITGAVRWRPRPIRRPANRFPVCLTVHRHPEQELAVTVEVAGGLLSEAAVTGFVATLTELIEQYP